MAKSTKSPPKFSGALDQPIIVEKLSGLPPIPVMPKIIDSEAVHEEYQELIKQYNLRVAIAATEAADKKIPLLFQHYQIPQDSPSKWEILSLRLAQDFVTGFSLVHQQSGAPKKWHTGLIAALYLDVEDEFAAAKEANRNTNRKEVFHKLAGKEQWRHLGGSKNLQNQYDSAMKTSFKNMVDWLDTLPKDEHDHKRRLLEAMAGRSK